MDEDRLRVYVKCVLTGEPARVLRELQRRGIVCSVGEAVAHGLMAYYEAVLEVDVKEGESRRAHRRRKR